MEAVASWKALVNDRYSAVISAIMGFSTGTLVLPVSFLRDFLGVPAGTPLAKFLSWWAYAAWTCLLLAILAGLAYQYVSAKWIKNAHNQPTFLSAQTLERLLDWTFWLCAALFLAGVLLLTVFLSSAAA